MTEQAILPGTEVYTMRGQIPLDHIRTEGELPPPPRDLKASVEVFGLVNPITVVSITGTDEFRLMAGRRRLAVAYALGWPTIEAVIHIEGAINEAALALTENAVRGPNPIEEMGLIAGMMLAGADEKGVAALTGMPVQTIRKRLKLSRLIAPAIRLAAQGVIAESVAEAMSSLPKDVQQDLLNTVPGHMVTAAMVREAKSVVQQKKWGALRLDGLEEDGPDEGPARSWQSVVEYHMEQIIGAIPAEATDLRDFLLTGYAMLWR